MDNSSNPYSRLFYEHFPNIGSVYSYEQIPIILEHLQQVQESQALICKKLAQIMGSVVYSHMKLTIDDEQEDHIEVSKIQEDNKIQELLMGKVGKKKIKYNNIDEQSSHEQTQL